jgi:hypothetical protein
MSISALQDKAATRGHLYVKGEIIMRNYKLVLVFAVVIALATAAFAQADQVLVSGKNQLKRSEINTMIDFYEWALEAKFSDSQRERFAEYTVNEFKANPAEARKTVSEIVTTYPRLKAAQPDVQQSARETFVSEFIALARKGDDENSKMLVEIYESARAGNASTDNGVQTQPAANTVDTAAAEPSNGDDPGSIGDLAGKWAWGRTGSTTKTTSGVYLGGNASRFTYEFDARGNAVMTGIMTVMTGGCKMEVFRTARGKASLIGDQLTINWQPASFSRADTCSPAKDYKKTLPAEREIMTVKFRTDYGQKQLCLTSKEEMCYSPSN